MLFKNFKRHVFLMVLSSVSDEALTTTLLSPHNPILRSACDINIELGLIAAHNCAHVLRKRVM